MNVYGITGPPRSGKTTLAGVLEEHGATVVHTDKWRKVEWSHIPELVRDFVHSLEADTVVVEGIHVPRVIRYGLACPLLVVVMRPVMPLTPRQVGTGKSVRRWVDRLPATQRVEYVEAWRDALPLFGVVDG